MKHFGQDPLHELLFAFLLSLLRLLLSHLSAPAFKCCGKSPVKHFGYDPFHDLLAAFLLIQLRLAVLDRVTPLLKGSENCLI
jgi:hypothetical protein